MSCYYGAILVNVKSHFPLLNIITIILKLYNNSLKQCFGMMLMFSIVEISKALLDAYLTHFYCLESQNG
jgi:ABC-type microcin C transport system permease subunit YejE